MTKPTYSAFDPAALGAGLDLSQSNTVLTVGQTTDINRTARSLYGKSAGAWYGEFLIWGDGTLAGYSSVGVVDSAASLTTYVGGDSHGCGLLLGDGKVKINAADVDTFTAGNVGDIIGVSLVFDDSGIPTVTFAINNAVVSTQTLGAGTYFLAASLGGVQAGALNCLLNCGQRGFEDGADGAGWYIVPTLLDTIYLASGEYITAPTDDPPSAPFDATILASQSFAVLRQMNFDIEGGGAVTPATATLELANTPISKSNPAGRYDDVTAAAAEMIGRPVMLQELASENAAYSTATGAGNFVITDVNTQDENVLRLTLKDSISLLDLPLQNHLILPNAEANAVNQPWPFVLGAARSVPLTLIDAEKYVYAVSDVPVVGFGYVRDKGDAFDPNASPPDYTIGSGRTTITLGSQAQGVVTGDFSSVGGGTDPTSAADIFASAGNPFTGTAGTAPTGWVQQAGWGTRAPYMHPFRANVVQFSPDVSPVGVGGVCMKLSAANTMLAGRSYRLTVTIETADNAHPYSDTTQPGDTQKSLRMVRDKNSAISNPVWSVPCIPGTYSTVITNTGASFTPIFCVIDAGTGKTPYVNISGLSLLEIADTYVPSKTLPIKLADFIDAIMAKLRKIGVIIPWSRADAEAIDAETGFAGIGYAAIGATTARAALSMALASYCACAWMDSTGTLRFTRLAIPEEKTVTLSLDSSDFRSDMAFAPSLLPGLTTQVGYRYNWTILQDSDFVTDFIDVPSSLRRAMSKQCQAVVATAVNLSPAYAAAVFNKPFWSLLDKQVDAQALADYFGRIGSAKRGGYTVDLDRGTVSLGQIVKVTHTRYGLTAGKNLQVKTINERQLDLIDTVTFWG